MEEDEICHSISELSVDEDDDQELYDLFGCDTQENISREEDELHELELVRNGDSRELEDSFCDSRELLEERDCDSRLVDSTQTTLSQNESIDSQFKRLPEMAKFFKKSRSSTNNKIISTCLRCSVPLRTRELSRMSRHIMKCKKVTPEERSEFAEIVSGYALSLESSKINLHWTRVMVENNYSFNSVNSYSFKKFFGLYLPKWRIPQAANISNTYIPHLSSRIEQKFFKRLRDSGESYLSVEFDHWSDANKRSLLGVVVTQEDGSKYLLDMIDVSLEGHRSSVIVEKLSICLSKIEPHRINSFVSDSASNCKAAREQMVLFDNYKTVIQHRCLAHLVNRIGNHITSSSCMSSILKAASKIAKKASNNTIVLARVRQSDSSRIVVANPVRWYSYTNMLSSLINNKAVIVEELSDSQLLEDTNIWSNMARAYKALRPFAICIGTLESKNTSAGEAMNCIFKLGKHIFELDWTDTFNRSIVTAYLTYISPSKLNNDEFNLLLAAYALDPRFMQNYLTEDGIDLALRGISIIATKMGNSWEFIMDVLRPEFEDYVLRKVTVEMKKSASIWWSRRKVGALRIIALKLSHLKASSANIERTFSSLKYIQGPYRLNLSLPRLIDIGRIRIGLQNNTSVTVESESANAEVEETKHSPKPELLSEETRKIYDEFIKYVDFRIINQPSRITTSSKTVVDQSTIEDMLALSRNSRALKRAAEDL